MAHDQATKTSVTTQIYEIYIKATPQAIWDAITTPEWTAKYGYGGMSEYDLRPGGAFRARATPEMVSMGLPEVLDPFYEFQIESENGADFTCVAWANLDFDARGDTLLVDETGIIQHLAED